MTKQATTKAHGLYNPAATTGGHHLDVSFIPTEDDQMWIVFRQCDYDNSSKVSVEDARETYRRCLRSGYKVDANPTYSRVEISNRRIRCYH